MKILLIHLPLILYLSPPSNISYIKSYLNRNNVECDVIDLNLRFQEHFNIKSVPPTLPEYTDKEKFDILSKEKGIKEFMRSQFNVLDYDIVGINYHSSQSINFLRLVNSILQEIMPNARQVVGGTGVINLKMHNISEFETIDVPGEIFFQKLLDLPDFKLYDYPQMFTEDFRKSGRVHHLNIFLDYGCVNHCNFCLVNKINPKIMFRSISSFCNELSYIMKTYNFYSFSIITDNINNSEKRLHELCYKLSFIKKIYKDFKWRANFALQNHSPDYELLSKTGCELLSIGIETGSESVRESMNKSYLNSKIVEHLDECLKWNIGNKFYLMVGYPSETLDEFNKSMEFFKTIFSKYYRIIKEIKITYYEHDDVMILPNNIKLECGESSNNWTLGELNLDERIRRLNEVYDLAKSMNIKIRAHTYE